MCCVYGCGRSAGTPSPSADFRTKVKEYIDESHDGATFISFGHTLPEVGDRAARITQLFARLPPVPSDTNEKEKVEDALLSIYVGFEFAVRLQVLNSRNGEKPNREELEKEQADFKEQNIKSIIKNCNFLRATLGIE